MANGDGPYDIGTAACRTQLLAPGYPRPPIGALCGVAAATCWAAGFVAAKHGIANGLSPADLAFHRFVWSGLLLLPLMAKAGFGDLGGVGWRRGLIMLVLAGPLQAIISYTGFTLCPSGTWRGDSARRVRLWAALCWPLSCCTNR